MGTFVIVVQLILALSILVILHELGHFIPARLFKTRVEKFYLFFNPWFSLFKFKKGDTEYGIGWLPLGGYVKISGMIDESMDTEQMKEEPKPWEFRSKPAWQRLIIMTGGVIVNVILAIVIYAMIAFFWGNDYIKNEDLKHGLAFHELFEEIGFQDGDKILKIDGEKVITSTEIEKHLFLRNVSTVDVIHENGEIETLSIPEDFEYTMFRNGLTGNGISMRLLMPTEGLDSILPNTVASKIGLEKNDKIIAINNTPIIYYDELSDQIKKTKGEVSSIEIIRNSDTLIKSVQFDTSYTLGVLSSFQDQFPAFSHQSYSFSESIPAGFSEGYYTLHDYIAQMKFLFTKKGATQLGGFGTIAKIFPTKWDWKIFWNRTAFLSVVLAFMNILPIPALDGGHVMFLLYEIVSGRPPSDKFLEKAQLVGVVLLLSLMLFANWNDAVRWFNS